MFKWDQLPPLKGPDPQGIQAPLQQPKRFKIYSYYFKKEKLIRFFLKFSNFSSTSESSTVIVSDLSLINIV